MNTHLDIGRVASEVNIVDGPSKHSLIWLMHLGAVFADLVILAWSQSVWQIQREMDFMFDSDDVLPSILMSQ